MRFINIFIISLATLFYSCNLIAHPGHGLDIQNQITHSHTGIEYLIVFSLISIALLALATKKSK